MKVRKQVVMTEDSWAAVKELTDQANDGFKQGHINYSDTINLMILSAKVDVDTLRSKNIDLKRTLKSWANQKNPDVDLLMKELSDFKAKTTRKKKQAQIKEVV